MKSLLIFALCFGSLAQAESRLPSFVSVSGAIGNEDYKSGSIQLGLTLPYNWQIEAGGERTITKSGEDDGEVTIRSGHIGVSSDPDRLVSFRVEGEGWSIPESVSASGGRAGITLNPGAWSVTAEYSKQKLSLSELPYLVSTSGTTEVNDEGLSLRVSNSSLRNWVFSVAGSKHDYDRDLSRLDELPAITLSRMPDAVMTSLLGLNKNDVGLSATYLFRKWDLGLEVGRSLSAVDDAKTRRLGVIATYYWRKAWSFGINSFVYRPEGSSESGSPSHSTSITATFKW